MLKLFCFILLTNFAVITHATESEISAGTTIKTRLAEQIDSRMRSSGYRFRLTIDSDIEKNGRVVIKSGSKAQATITNITKSGKGLAPASIIVTLTTLNMKNRQINVESFQTAGKGTSNERQEVGYIDEYESVVFGRQGEQITAAIPVITRGYDILLAEGTVIYFILKEPIPL